MILAFFACYIPVLETPEDTAPVLDWSAPENQWPSATPPSSTQGEGYEQAPIIVISGGRETKPKIVQTTPFRDLVTTDYNNNYIYVNTTSVPDHFYNSPNVKAQNFVFGRFQLKASLFLGNPYETSATSCVMIKK